MQAVKKIQKSQIVVKAHKNKQEFVEFIKEYNVIQMAIGVVIGNAVKELVTSLANNLIMPFVNIMTPSGSWKELEWSVGNAQFKIGLLISSLLDFFIVALVVFIVINKILKIDIKKSK